MKCQFCGIEIVQDVDGDWVSATGVSPYAFCSADKENPLFDQTHEAKVY